MWSVSIASATWSDASAAIPVASLRGGCPSTPSRARSPKFRYCRKSSAFEFAPYCASQCDSCFPWRRGWDSKPRGSCEPSGFQARHAPSVDKESRARRRGSLGLVGANTVAAACSCACLLEPRYIAALRNAEWRKLERDVTERLQMGGSPVLGKIGGRRISSVFGGQ